jgi:hypothetical protein
MLFNLRSSKFNTPDGLNQPIFILLHTKPSEILVLPDLKSLDADYSLAIYEDILDSDSLLQTAGPLSRN